MKRANCRRPPFPLGHIEKLGEPRPGISLKKHAGPSQVFLAPPRGAGWAQPGPGGAQTRADPDGPRTLPLTDILFENRWPEGVGGTPTAYA